MDRYPNLRSVLVAEFGSVYRFCKEAGLPESRVKHLILGDLGPLAETRNRLRVEKALKRLRPSLNLNGIWAKFEPETVSERIEVVGRRRLRIVTTVITEIEDLGPADETESAKED
jgi:hypothetical protein